MDFATLPKIELHLHLDCSLSYAAVSRIDPSVTLQEYQQDFNGPASFANLEEFFKRAPRGTALMQTEEQIRLVTFDVFEQLRRDNILYAEILLVPFMHTSQGLSAENVVEIANDALAGASSETGVEARIILSTLRHYSTQQSLATVKLVERFNPQPGSYPNLITLRVGRSLAAGTVLMGEPRVVQLDAFPDTTFIGRVSD